jgi:selenocysteine lyase/cysteine desulfurase
MNKREFIRTTSLLTLGALPSLGAVEKAVARVSRLSPESAAGDEDFWAEIRGGYRLKPDYINLENGYYCFLPQETLENHIRHIREVNYQGSYYMRTVQIENKKKAAARLAELAGCSPEELVITRNTTESLDLVIGGLDWKAGDEAVMAEQDYGAMLNHFKQVAKRYGVVNKIVSVPNHPASDEEIVKLYEQAITSRTKLLMICHMINITGHILPVRKICDMAHGKGVEVLVDGAHAFAHINFSIPELGCDYYGSSLHKWLSVPLGAGLLYMKKEKISKVWPLLAPGDLPADDIYRLNHTGTNPVHTHLAILDAIDYYLKVGRDRKEARLRYLQRYWTEKVRDAKGVVVNTPADPARHCGIGNAGVEGMKPSDLADTLHKKYGIYTVPIDGAGVHGCRITPNLYTTPKELDVLVSSLKALGNGGRH